jgi:hypothetical protein
MKIERWQAELLDRMVERDAKTGRWTAKRLVLRLPRRRIAPISVSDSMSSDEPPSVSHE